MLKPPPSNRTSFALNASQKRFTEDDVRTLKVQRMQPKTDWKKIFYPPQKAEDNWSLLFPFQNTYQNAFLSMCADTKAHPTVVKGGRLMIFLNDTAGDDKPTDEVDEWVEIIKNPVAMKDFLAISFALDYDKVGGNPDSPQTEIGLLRARAKPYGTDTPTADTQKAADLLVKRCLEFLDTMTCYNSADCIVAMPPSNSSKRYNLPRYLAQHIVNARGLEDLTHQVQSNDRSSIKRVSLASKFDTLHGTISVDHSIFKGRSVMLIDDVYQSGTSLNYCGSQLLKAGASKIFGLACEKTCRNDSNVR